MLKPLAADVGPTGVVGVVDPESCGLVLTVQGYEFYSEQGAKMPYLAA